MMDFATATNEFAELVAKQNQAIKDGDAKRGNLYAKRYLAIFDELRSHGDIGRNALAELLTHDRADVRVMAAVFLLRHCEIKAKAVLQREASGNGLVAVGAAQALERWKDGTWALDPE
jgi:Domain of unknown function (DUF2019)